MKVRFRTKIDCCKVFMWTAHDISYSPIIGDDVVVYDDAKKTIELRVVNRSWYKDELVIELHLKPIWHGRFPEFEKWVKS